MQYRTTSHQSKVASRVAWGLTLLSGLFLLAAGVHAQGVNTDATQLLNEINASRPSADMATRLMEGLLGQSYTLPWTTGLTTNTLFGAIFLTFNVCVFAVGSLYASYGVVAGIVQTAHEGAVLGKRMSAIWMPVRMVVGIGGLIPAFGGFSLSQIMMIVATAQGISIGNYAYTQALTFASSSSTLVNSSFIRTNPKKDPNAMAQALFFQRLCEKDLLRKKADYLANGQAVPPDVDVRVLPIESVWRSEMSGLTAGDMIGRVVGSVSKPLACPSVAIQRKRSWYAGDQTGRNGTSALGFRSGAVNYEQISQQAWIGYAANFQGLVNRVQRIADEYDLALKANGAAAAAAPFPTQEIRAAGIWYGGAVQTTDVKHETISKDALTKMGQYGFFGAGSYYSTHAEVSAAVMQAADATEFLIQAPDRTKESGSGDYDSTSGAYAPLSAEGSVKDGKCNMAVRAGIAFSTVGMGNSLSDLNDTGNCSVGQNIVKKVLELGAAGSGGASTVIDPIIALKNIGDYMMTTGEVILASLAATGQITNGTEKASGVASTVMSAVVSKVPTLSGFAKAFGAMLPYIGGLMFAVGALCAIYLPMVPFINWVSGLVQYCCIVVESMAAAPLWAFAHLQAEGEGMGPKTERGYVYLMNLLFRPIMMVVAFFAASALVILLGSLIFQLFLPAMAAAQGNSITGAFSAIGYVFLFFLIMTTIIQGMFHLVMELPDDVIGWVGGIGKNAMGKGMDDKAHNVFMAGGRFGSGGVDRMSAANRSTRGLPKPPTPNIPIPKT